MPTPTLLVEGFPLSKFAALEGREKALGLRIKTASLVWGPPWSLTRTNS